MDFTTHFNHLQGLTLGERKKNLYRLLKDAEHLPKTDQFFASLKPNEANTFLENSFKVDSLIHFRRTLDLLEVLKQGNEVFISKIIKQEWFFKEAFSATSGKEFVNAFLPQVSYSSRMKILKRIGQIFGETKVDEIFDCVVDRYGVYIAKVILPSCSPQKIKETLKNNRIPLSCSQIKRLFDKDVDLLLTYLDHCKQNSVPLPFQDKNLKVHIAQKNPVFYWQLREKYRCTYRFGRRTTKRALPPVEAEVITSPQDYVDCFRSDKLVRILGKHKQFKTLYKNIFPRDKKDVERLYKNSSPLKLLKYYPRNRKFELFSEVYSEVFEEPIWNNMEAVLDYFLPLLPDQTVRKQVATYKYKKNDDLKYVVYYPSTEAIQILCEKIKVTSSIPERAKILKYLAETCRVNNDLNALADVLKYFCARHRNDHGNARREFLGEILDKFKEQSDCFTDTHWKYINEIITVQKIKYEPQYANKFFRIKYLEFLYNNGQSIVEPLKQYLEEPEHLSGSEFQMDTYTKNREFARRFYQVALDLLADFRADERNGEFLALVKCILLHNKTNPEYSVPVQESPKLREILLAFDKADSYDIVEIISSLIRRSNRSDFDNELLKVYFTKYSDEHFYENRKIAKWFLKYEPSVLVQYSDEIVDYCIKKDEMLLDWFQIKLYAHLTLDSIFKHRFNFELEKEENYDNKLKISRPLSVLLTTEEYVKIVRGLLPVKVKVDTESDQDSEEYKIRREYAKNLKNVLDNHSQALDLVVIFCTGDYLSSTLSALYSLFYRTPEYLLDGYLKQFEKKSDSARKHTFFLSSIVLTQVQVKNYFDPTKQGNIRLAKHMLKSALSYFLKNPSDDTFNRVAYLLDNMKEIDEESLKLLIGADVSKKYRAVFIEKAWGAFERLRKETEGAKSTFDKLQFDLLNKVQGERVRELSEHFCSSLIQNYFLQLETNVGTEVLRFVCQCLLYRPERNASFDFVFGIIQRFKDDHWVNHLPLRERLYNFFWSFHREINNTDFDSDSFNMFSERWLTVFSPLEAFDEYISLKLLHIKIECSTPFHETLPPKIVQFFLQTLNDLGNFVFNSLASDISNFLGFLNLQHHLELFLNMLEFSNRNDTVCLLVLELMSGLWLTDETKEIEDKLFRTLGSVESDIVKFRYNLYIKQRVNR